MFKLPAVVLLLLSSALQPMSVDTISGDSITGEVVRLVQFPSHLVESRNIDIWLPPGYAAATAAGTRYPVLYMHDGQNLYDPETSLSSHVDWGIDETLTRMIGDGDVPPVIVVGIWSRTGYQRFLEYMPKKAITPDTLDLLARQFGELTGEFDRKPTIEHFLSDHYLKFLVYELKPYIDNNYATLSDQKNTMIMGSSMGGLISAYAISEYPEVFAAAGCVSTHFSAGDGAIIAWLAQNLPDPGGHRIYFDYGTETLDRDYDLYQRRMDTVMLEAGYTQGVNWVTRKFQGHAHSEIDWRKRVHIPLEFLLSVK